MALISIIKDFHPLANEKLLSRAEQLKPPEEIGEYDEEERLLSAKAAISDSVVGVGNVSPAVRNTM